MAGKNKTLQQLKYIIKSWSMNSNAIVVNTENESWIKVHRN